MAERQFDVLVVGAGPGGLAAAVRAAEAGALVGLVDEQPGRGGQIWRRDRGTSSSNARPWIERAEQAGVSWIPGTSVVDVAAPDELLGEGPDGVVSLGGRQIVLATGARERYLPFPGSTHPAVTGAGGLQALVKGGLEVDGERVLVAGSGPLLLAVADFMRGRGARVVALVEQARFSSLARLGLRLAAHPSKLLQLGGLQRRLVAVPKLHGSWVTAVEPAAEGLRVTVRRGARARTFEVDRVAVGFGLISEVRLASLLGCTLVDGAVEVDAYQRTSREHVLCVGEPTGIGGVDKALVEGQVAGLVAAGRPEQARSLLPRRDRARRFAAALEEAFALRDELRSIATPDSIVCRCEDVPLARVAAVPDARTARLVSRCGMGACQGRMCAGALTFLRGWPESGFRPPLYPVTVGGLARAWSAASSENTP